MAISCRIFFIYLYQLLPEISLPLVPFYMNDDFVFLMDLHQSLIVRLIIIHKSIRITICFSTYAKHPEELYRLKHEGFVTGYQANFEKLRNQVLGLPYKPILNCFISSLIPKIQNEMVIQRPFSISRAIGLVKLIQTKLEDVKPKFQKPFSNSFNHIKYTPYNISIQ